MRIKHLLKTTALTALLLIGAKVGWGQAFTFTSGSLTYSENFDVMGATGTTYPTGWTAIRYSGTGTLNQTLTLVVTDGATSSGGILNVGTASATDRCIGALGSGSTVPTYGASLKNSTGSTITDLTIAFTVEQWKSGSSNTANEKNIFQYSLDATSLTTGTWTAVSALDLNEILTTTTTAAAVNGNLPANQATVNGTVSGLSLANESTIWFRWIDDDVTGSDGILAVDNLSITAGFDTNPPTFSSVSPVDNSTDIAVNSTLSLTLSENIAKGAGNILINKVSDETNELTIDVTSSNVTISGKTATIKLPSFLKEGIEYYVVVPNGCITDLAGNAFAGITVKGDWSFTTLATVSPTIRLDYPNGGEKVYAGDNVTFRWTSSNMTGENVKIEVYVYNYGTSTWGWIDAILSTANDGSELYTIPAGTWYGTQCKARITGLTSTTATDESDANFTIIATPTISDIQSNMSNGDKSIYDGTIVRFNGIVTAKKSSGSGYFVQSGTGVNSGIYVYATVSPVAVGDDVTIEGTVSEYLSTTLYLTEITTNPIVTVNSHSNTLPSASTITTAQLLEPYEGVLIKVVNAEVKSTTTIDDGSGVTGIGVTSSDLYTYTPVVGAKLTITGLGYYSSGAFKIQPRYAADIVSANATVTSAGTYVVTDATSVISNVPYTVSVTNFKSGLVFPANSTYNVYEADGTNTASVIDDTKLVKVTAQDGLTKRTYTIVRNAASTDATLSNLTSGGTQVPSFAAGTLIYNIELPFATTVVPTVVATTTDANAVANITYATDLAGDAAARTTSILVTAEDGSTTKTYTIVYTIAAPKTDKTLSDLKFGTNTVDGFSPSVLAYSVVLPIGTTNPAPTVSATVNDATATVEITQAQNVDGTQIERTASVKVTAQDLSSQTYTVEFSVAIPGADATLSDLMIDGTTVAGFTALTTTYNVALAAGTATVPTVTVTKNDVNATYQITPATNLAGTEAERTTTILVTAQNTTTTKTYTVVFRVKSANADLSDLTYDATTVPSFNATTLTYNVVLPHSHGTTSVPVVAATKVEANASVSITQAANLTGTEAERTATVVVTADDNNYTKTYTIVFSVAKDTDAQLTAITYDGTAVSGFDPATLNYYVTLAFGTSTVPVVAATKSDENASANIVQAQNLGGTSAERTATITVTAEDGIATKVYTVTFRVDNVAKELFFSEYIEGSSNNRAFEIFNPFSAPVDLSGYTVKCSYNGGGFGKRDGVDDSRYILTFAPGTMIAAGDVYLIYNSTAGTGISSVGDLSLEYSGTANVGNGSNIPSFTGNDALGLYKGTTLIDVFGGELVTANFDVAGVTEASVNHSIVRKPTVHKGNTTWSTSAGSTADNSEWIVNGIDVFTDLGKHTTNPTDPSLTVSATTLADFGSIISGTVGRGEASFTVAGSLLSGDVTITAPAGFQISKSSGNDFVSEGPITLAQTSGAVAATTIYVKFSPLAVQAYSDFIIVSSQEITSKKVTVSGTGVATDDMPPSFTEGPSSINVEPYKFDVKFKVNEGGKVYIVKLASGSAEPSNTLVITDPSAVVVNVAPNTSYTQTFSGLTKNTAYDLYFVAGDNQASTNISGVTKLTVTTMDIPVVAIYDIQYTTDVAGNSPKMNTWVETTGIVTAVKGTSGFFMQSATGAWNGIYVNNTAPTVTAGDVVKVTGKIIETNKVTAFESTSVVENQNSPTTVPEPVVVTTLAANNEQYEGVFVKVSHANCVSGSAGSYVVNDNSGALTVYKGIYTGLTLTISTKYNIQGVMDYYNTSSLWELYPRSSADVVDATGINDNTFSNLTVYPNPFSNEIRFDGAQNVKRVVVTSVTGQVVKNETVVGTSVNTESLPQGMYLVTLYNDKGAKTTLKMIKQ